MHWRWVRLPPMRRALALLVLCLPACAPQAPAVAPGAAAKTGSLPTEVEPRTKLVWVSLPAGDFLEGCEPQDSMCPDGASAPKTVHVSAIQMLQTEVTLAAYAACARSGACVEAATGKDCNAGLPDRDAHPVNCVDHAQASAFCAWVGGRLPTPSEWEYAAKSGGSRVFPWGDAAPDDTRAQYAAAQTAPVGTHPAGATPWGLQDMAGNVNEWTDGERSPGVKEMRGGSFAFPESRRLRASNRGGGPPALKAGNVGFRCAKGL